MLGYVTAQGRGTGDRLLYDLAGKLRAEGFRIAGAVQSNVDRPDTPRCDMFLDILAGAETVRISQNLGRGASGCRLDPQGLERAVGLVIAALDGPVDLVIINKFGKQESEIGRGFRPVFAAALERGLPVLTSVTAGQTEAFLDFAGPLAENLPGDPDVLLAWARAAAGRGAAA
ncbi:DUF2478 domain-containing protein [Ostreiculturibacter nitratireducens]|uniref:DUF2478 domain-containing protein n=1 Tax=Ostreiculturibacter nitratireducens TaxID=3075226 RepID=UPI0031B5980B